MTKGDAPRIDILVRLDDSATVRELKNLTNTFKKSAQEIDAIMSGVSRVMNGVTAVVGAVVGEVIALTKEYEEQERITRRWTQAMIVAGDTQLRMRDRLNDFNDALQQQLGIGDDVLQSLQGTLVAMGVYPTRLEEATRATIGLSEATGQGLNEAAKVVAKAFQGNTEGLREYAIVVKDVDEAERRLQELYELAIAQQGTAATAYATTAANIGDAREELGKLIVTLPAVEAKTKLFAEASRELRDALAEDGAAVRDFTSDLVKWTSDGIESALVLLPVYGLVLKSHEFAFKGLLSVLRDVNDEQREFNGLLENSPLDPTKIENQFPAPLLSPGVSPYVAPKKGRTKKPGAPDLDDLSDEARGILEQPTAFEEEDAEQERRQRELEEGTKALAEIEKMYAREAKIQQNRAEITAENEARRIDIKNEALEAEQNIIEQALELAIDQVAREQQIAQMRSQMIEQLAMTGINAISNMVSGITEIIASGTDDAMGAIGRLMGGMLKQIGQTMIQMGVLLGIVAAFGAPGVAGTAAALVGGGIGAVALGSALESGSSDGGGGGGGGRLNSSDRITARAAGGGRRDRYGGIGSNESYFPGGLLGANGAAPVGFVSGGGGTIVNNYTLSFGGSTIIGEPTARTGRKLRDFIREAEKLEGGGRGRS